MDEGEGRGGVGGVVWYLHEQGEASATCCIRESTHGRARM